MLRYYFYGHWLRRIQEGLWVASMTPTQPPQTPKEKAEAYASTMVHREHSLHRSTMLSYLAGRTQGLRDAKASEDLTLAYMVGHEKGKAEALSSSEVMGLVKALEFIGCKGFRAKREDCTCTRCRALQRFHTAREGTNGS